MEILEIELGVKKPGSLTFLFFLKKIIYLEKSTKK